MRTTTVRLPNGFKNATGEIIRSVDIRKFGGEEEDLLVDKEELKKGDILLRILKMCTVSMGDISDPVKVANMYDEFFLQADLTFLLISLRMWGIGNRYAFEHQCPLGCDQIRKHVIDLGTLRVDQQKDDDRGKLEFLRYIKDAPQPFDANGELLPYAKWTYGDVPFRFRPLLTRDSKMLDAIRQDYPKEKATRELGLQLIDYDGRFLPPAALRKLDSGTRNRMREEIDATSGGVDIEILMSCKKCQRSYKDNLPVDIKHFFFRVGVSSEIPMATPFRDDGTTLISWLPALDGNQAKFKDSPSLNVSST